MVIKGSVRYFAIGVGDSLVSAAVFGNDVVVLGYPAALSLIDAVVEFVLLASVCFRLSVIVASLIIDNTMAPSVYVSIRSWHVLM
ncbi:hypothetical protein Dimus_030446 [Dionaea muscipula]